MIGTAVTDTLTSANIEAALTELRLPSKVMMEERRDAAACRLQRFSKGRRLEMPVKSNTEWVLLLMLL